MPREIKISTCIGGLTRLGTPELVVDAFKKAGFKYFDIGNVNRIRICFAGNCDGVMQVSDDPSFTRLCASVPAKNTAACTNETAEIKIEPGVRPLFFRYTGSGALDFYSFELQDSAQA